MLSTRNRMFSYRLYPSPKQIKVLDGQLSMSCLVYNYLLELRIRKYKEEKKSLGKFDLNKEITKLKKEHSFLKGVHSQVLQNLSDKLQKAYENFFRRVKAGEKPGFPRFKSSNRFNSMTFPQSGFEIIGDSRLQVSKVGLMKIILHRPIKGQMKTMTIKKTPTGKWFAVFSCEVPFEEVKPHPRSEREIGIDVGLENFAVLSDGTKIENPRYLIASKKRLAILQKRLSKKKKGSNHRRDARLKVARLHETMANQRHDFSHKVSRLISNKYGKIAVENLNILGMVKHPYLAKHINDASWGAFTRNLAYKAALVDACFMSCRKPLISFPKSGFQAAEAGCEFVKVEPRGTSQECSRCGTRVPKTLAQRWHRCPSCGLEIDRDLNASRNILKKASTFGTEESQACGDGSPLLVLNGLEVSPSAKQEAPPLSPITMCIGERASLGTG